MRPEVKIISLNIEGHKHLDRVIPFFRKVDSDVILLQEVFKNDLDDFARNLGMKSYFADESLRALNYYTDGIPLNWGLGILTKEDRVEFGHEYYHPDEPIIPEFGPGHIGPLAPLVVFCRLKKQGSNFCFATTHFPWSDNGQASEEQRIEIDNLFRIINKLEILVLTGDFNAPRGREIFNKISQRLKDNIPAQVTTTIDGNLHKAGFLQLVVDGLFTTCQYQADDVCVIDGLSDHCAITARISKL